MSDRQKLAISRSERMSPDGYHRLYSRSPEMDGSRQRKWWERLEGTSSVWL